MEIADCKLIKMSDIRFDHFRKVKRQDLSQIVEINDKRDCKITNVCSFSKLSI